MPLAENRRLALSYGLGLGIVASLLAACGRSAYPESPNLTPSVASVVGFDENTPTDQLPSVMIESMAKLNLGPYVYDPPSGGRFLASSAVSFYNRGEVKLSEGKTPIPPGESTESTETIVGNSTLSFSAEIDQGMFRQGVDRRISSLFPDLSRALNSPGQLPTPNLSLTIAATSNPAEKPTLRKLFSYSVNPNRQTTDMALDFELLMRMAAKTNLPLDSILRYTLAHLKTQAILGTYQGTKVTFSNTYTNCVAVSCIDPKGLGRFNNLMGSPYANNLALNLADVCRLCALPQT